MGNMDQASKAATPVPKQAGVDPSRVFIGLGIAAMIFVGTFIVCAVLDGGTPAKPVAQQSAVNVTVSQLTDAYQANEVAADQQWRGKYVYTRGEVRRIGKDILDQPFVILKGEGGSQIQCLVRRSDLDRAGRLKVGQTIGVSGTVAGLTLGTVLLRECLL